MLIEKVGVTSSIILYLFFSKRKLPLITAYHLLSLSTEFAHLRSPLVSEISWDEAMPGDLVFGVDDGHVGIVAGRDEHGNLLIIHCTSGSLNGVVITDANGFVSVCRPHYYA